MLLHIIISALLFVSKYRIAYIHIHRCPKKHPGRTPPPDLRRETPPTASPTTKPQSTSSAPTNCTQLQTPPTATHSSISLSAPSTASSCCWKTSTTRASSTATICRCGNDLSSRPNIQLRTVFCRTSTIRQRTKTK